MIAKQVEMSKREIEKMRNDSRQMTNGKWLTLGIVCSLLLTLFAASVAPAQSSQATPAAPDFQSVIARQASLVTEFDVNGLKVLIKRREGSQSVATGLFIRGGSENITAANAGIEAFMLNVASEASANYPRDRMRKELARMGTVIGAGVNYDYSVLSMTSTRAFFDHSCNIFGDVSLHPSLNRPEGTAESVSHLAAEDLRAYHQKTMQTSRLLLVIVGDLDASQIRPRVVAAFGKLPRGDYKVQAPPQLSFASSTVDVTPRELPTNYVQGMFSAPPITSPDI